MELDVAAAIQRPGSPIPIRQREAKRVIAPRLPPITHIHLIGEPALTVDLGCALDMTRHIVNYFVGCNASSLHLWAIPAMVDIGQMAPKSAVLHPTCYTEGPLRARRCPGDPSSTGHKVPTRARGAAAGDVGVRKGDDD